MDDQKIVFSCDGIQLENPDGSLFNNSLNKSSYNQVIYYNGKWAEIITEEPEQLEINTYGLKVGDKLPADILNKWSSSGTNYYQKDESLFWRACSSSFSGFIGFIGDRKIESFKVIDGTLGFLVSSTDNVYLRAEGFKEFAESLFNEPQFETGKWYKEKKYNHTIKYLRTKSHDSKYAIVYSDFISGNGEYKSCPEGKVGVGYIDDKDWYELTDLSEIQQYLPDGHPDKIKTQPEYIVGKWYRLGAWIAKFKELDKNKFYNFKSGTPFDNYKTSDGYLIIDYQETPVLITDMTEVYELFPEEKPSTSYLKLNKWYKKDDFIVYLYARNSVYGFHRDKWFESTGFNEDGLILTDKFNVELKFKNYIQTSYKIGDKFVDLVKGLTFKIKSLHCSCNFTDKQNDVYILVEEHPEVNNKSARIFDKGIWAVVNSDWKTSEKELDLTLKNPCAEVCLTPSYEEWIKENNPKQDSTTELLLKSKNKKQKFVKLTEIKTIKL